MSTDALSQAVMKENFANVPNRQPLLAHILHREGVLDDAQLDIALRRWYVNRKEGPVMSFGQVVLTLGYITVPGLKPYIALQQALSKAPQEMKPLGVMVIESGLLKPSRLLEALKIQKTTGLRLGEVLVKYGYLRQAQLAPLLRLQGRKFTRRLELAAETDTLDPDRGARPWH